jgi:hemoglobin
MSKSLYERLGGYDGITAVVDNLLPRLAGDAKLSRFWAHRGSDGIAREKQLLIDFLAHAAGGPMYYTGRTMKLSHVGMRVDAEDWRVFIRHVEATLDAAHAPAPERADVLGFLGSLRPEIVEVE